VTVDVIQVMNDDNHYHDDKLWCDYNTDEDENGDSDNNDDDV
jgi:hypothetical protein